MFSFFHPIRAITEAMHAHGKAIVDKVLTLIHAKFPIAAEIAKELEAEVVTIVETHISGAVSATHEAVSAPPPPPPRPAPAAEAKPDAPKPETPAPLAVTTEAVEPKKAPGSGNGD